MTDYELICAMDKEIARYQKKVESQQKEIEKLRKQLIKAEEGGDHGRPSRRVGYRCEGAGGNGSGTDRRRPGGVGDGDQTGANENW